MQCPVQWISPARQGGEKKGGSKQTTRTSGNGLKMKRVRVTWEVVVGGGEGGRLRQLVSCQSKRGQKVLQIAVERAHRRSDPRKRG